MGLTLTAIILGIVEGITEYLPVSSTGHLILATELLGYNAARWDVFNIAIQPGAILAIIVLYWRTFMEVGKGLLRLDPASLRFVRNVLLAFIPAVVIGLAFHDPIEALLENGRVVAWALIIGGIAILVVERLARTQHYDGVSAVGSRTSSLIGVIQCLAMIPGISRSGATILGAMAMGVDRKTAAEFSFFLAVPTLVGATALLFAAKAGDVEVMRLLLQNGADPKINTDLNITPLMAAAGIAWASNQERASEEQVLEAVKLLVEEYGADVNFVADTGETAMHAAAYRGANNVVQYLFDKGAKLDVVDKAGRTPLAIADGVEYGNSFAAMPQTAVLLRKLGAKEIPCPGTCPNLLPMEAFQEKAQ